MGLENLGLIGQSWAWAHRTCGILEIKDKVGMRKGQTPKFNRDIGLSSAWKFGPYWAIMGLGLENLWEIGGKYKVRMRKRIKDPSLIERLGYHGLGLGKLGLLKKEKEKIKKARLVGLEPTIV